MSDLENGPVPKKGLQEKCSGAGRAASRFFSTGREKFRGLSRKKQIGSMVAGVLVVAVLGYFATGGLSRNQAQAAAYTEYTVARGDIRETVSGSGTIAPINQYSVVATVQGEVLSDAFQEGDTVEKGQLLYTIDSTDVENNIQRANLSLEKSNLTYADSQKALTGLSVTSSISGKVAEVYVKKGDSVQSGAQVAKVVDDKTLTAKVPFSETDVASLQTGQQVTVTVENTFEQLTGKITSISNGTRMLDGYMTVTDVTVTLSNPGALQEGIYVSVTAGTVASQAGAALEYQTEKIVKAETSGTVSSIVNDEGTYVSKGSVIVKMENDDAANSLKSSQLTLQEAELSYENTAKQLEDYNITAPISGSVIEKSVKAGDTIDNTSAQTVMAVIADMSQMTFTISVDELDIGGLEKGQEVTITADALPEHSFTGYVDSVSINGTSNNGVTTYPVKVVINDAADLWPGMNVTADIVIDSAEDVLSIPTSAVNRGNTVLMKDNTEQKVTLGLGDENNIEVSDGLAEGDVILVPEVKASAGSENQMPAMEGGMMPSGGAAPGGGGMSGGAPSGGGGAPQGGGGRGGN